jgi:2-dehydropantoate 2-reductase
VNWAADWIAPGRVQFGGTGSFVVGELDGALTPRARDLADLLSAVMPSGITDNIWGCLWAKVCFAALLFATALTDETVYDVVERPFPTQRMLVLLVAEAMAVAEASGVRLVAFDEYDPAAYRKGAAGSGASRRPWRLWHGSIGAHQGRRASIASLARAPRWTRNSASWRPGRRRNGHARLDRSSR